MNDDNDLDITSDLGASQLIKCVTGLKFFDLKCYQKTINETFITHEHKEVHCLIVKRKAFSKRKENLPL